jgi:hypothetical protein
MTLWSTQPLTQPYHLHVSTVLKSESLNLLETSGTVQDHTGITLPLSLSLHVSSICMLSDVVLHQRNMGSNMFFTGSPLRVWGAAVTQWLRYCATNRKVAGSIPDGVNGIFH